MKTRKIIRWWALLLCLLAIIPMNTMAQETTKPTYSGGSGTKDDPWIIATAEDLQAMSDNFKNGLNTFDGKYFKQTADIDMKSYPNFTGIRNVGCSFGGHYDGGGHVISNMTIDLPKQDYVGLFESININGTVHDVHLDSSCKIIGEDYVAGIVGELSCQNIMAGTASVYNCTSGASVSGKHHVGGIVSVLFQRSYVNSLTQAQNLAIWHCLNYGKITGTEGDVAGILGGIELGGQIIECMNLGTIKSPKNIYVGGITGYIARGFYSNSASGTINCANYGYVYGGRGTGGIVGFADVGFSNNVKKGSYVLHCLNVGAVKSADKFVGNIIGKTYGANTTDNDYDGRVLSYGNVYDKQEYTIQPISTTKMQSEQGSDSGNGWEIYYRGVNSQKTKSLVSGEVIDGLERGVPSLEVLTKDKDYNTYYNSLIFKEINPGYEGYSYKKGKYPTLAYWVRDNEGEKSTFEQSMASSEKAQEECRRILTLIDQARSTYLQFRDEDETSTSHAKPYEDADGVGHIATVYPQDAAAITSIVQPKDAPHTLFKMHDATGKQLDPEYRLEIKQYADTVWLKNGDFEKPVFVKNVLPKRIHLYIKNNANFSYGEEEKASLAPKSVSVKYWTTDIYGKDYQADASAGGSLWPLVGRLNNVVFTNLGAADYEENRPFYYAAMNNGKNINIVFARQTPLSGRCRPAIDAGYFLYDALIQASDDQPMTVTVDGTPFTKDIYGTDILSHSKSIADRDKIVNQENAWYIRNGEPAQKDKDKDAMTNDRDVTLNNVQDGCIQYTYTDKATNKKVTENRTIVNKGDVAYITSFSSHVAYKVGNGVEAYVVSDINMDENNATAVVTLTKPMATAKNEDGTTYTFNYIPANTGVILVVRSTSAGFADISSRNQESTTDNGFQTSTVTLSPIFDAIQQGYDGTSLLTSNPEGGSYTAPAKNAITDDTDIIYPFGFYRKSAVDPTETDDSKFLFGFWATTAGKHTIAPNRSYLTLKGSQAKKLGIGTTYDDWNNSSSTTTMATGKPCVLLNFEDWNSGAATAIDKVNTDNGRAPKGWFNLQGQRVSHPVAPGMYIHDGKKVIVKHLTK